MGWLLAVPIVTTRLVLRCKRGKKKILPLLFYYDSGLSLKFEEVFKLNRFSNSPF